ncbi:MAG: hypothetical protein JOY78_00400, partial [Pseudonocardia sp.]|nr:hypothetical protein [Pseudonocardia sp.]
MRVAQRLALAGRRHARHAADQAWRGKSIANHALVFLYHDPPNARIGDGLHTSSRLFLAGTDVVDLPTILAQLLGCATDYASGRGFDPRTQLSTHAELMASSAHYIGVAASTLSASPSPTAFRTGQEYDTPFRVLGLLIDETQLVVRGAGMTAPLDIRSTHTLDTGHTGGRQRWTWLHGDTDAAVDPQLPEVWAGLDDLHSVIMDTSV